MVASDLVWLYEIVYVTVGMGSTITKPRQANFDS